MGLHDCNFQKGTRRGYNNVHILCFCGDPNITSGAPPPAFVGTNYFCESGNPGLPKDGVVLTGNQLWDGMDCTTDNNCCEFNSPPWFNMELPAHTTGDIEVRLCCSQDTGDENILLQQLELYTSDQGQAVP